MCDPNFYCFQAETGSAAPVELSSPSPTDLTEGAPVEFSDERVRCRTPEDSVAFATGVVRLAGGTVTSDDLAAGRRVASGETTAADEIAAFRAELGF